MDLVALYAIDILGAIAILTLLSVGLAVVFRMMKIINLAHGEFMMLGGYVAILATNQWGVPIWISMLVLAPLAVGAFGVLVEHLLVRHLYGRMIDTMLATWGLSWRLSAWRPWPSAIPRWESRRRWAASPSASARPAAARCSWWAWRRSRCWPVVPAALHRLRPAGARLHADAAMASALGMNPNGVYKLTFGLGAALSGLAGAVLAPLTGIIPTIGAAYIAKAFITVISGGSAVIAGTISASGLFGAISQGVTFACHAGVWTGGVAAGRHRTDPAAAAGITGRFFKRAI